jgi:hypothetical protein
MLRIYHYFTCDFHYLPTARVLLNMFLEKLIQRLWT